MLNGGEYTGGEGEAGRMAMKAVGPVAQAFVGDKTMLTGIMGPFGSAKTTSCFQKYINGALWQGPGPDGIYRARWGVIRDTYPQLKKNILKSWFGWFPKDSGQFSGEAPYEHKIMIALAAAGRKIMIELEIMFIALGENKAEDVMKGLEITALHMNETDTLDRQVLSYGLGRIGRYPPERLGGCKWRGVIADFNAPDIDNWTYDVFVDGNLGLEPEQLEAMREVFGEHYGVAFHRQPGGMLREGARLVPNPAAENIANLPAGYYQQIVAAQTDNFVRRYVLNEFGAVRNGRPVFEEFTESVDGRPWHMAGEDFGPIPNVPVCVGVDGGTTPAAVLGQRDSLGQIRVFDEFVVFSDSEEDELHRVGAEAFGKALAEHIADRWPDIEIGEVWRDPATSAEEDRSWAKFFDKGLGIKTKSAPDKSNALAPRLEAVRRPLIESVEGGRPGIVCAPRCRFIRRALNNGYVYTRVTLSNGSGRWADKPVKNDFSHVMDALQYLCLGYAKGRDLPRSERHRKRREGGDRAGRGPRVVTDYAIHGGA